MGFPEVTFAGKDDLGSRGLVVYGQGQGRRVHLPELSLYVLHQNVWFPGQNGDDGPLMETSCQFSVDLGQFGAFLSKDGALQSIFATFCCIWWRFLYFVGQSSLKFLLQWLIASSPGEVKLSSWGYALS